MAKDTDAKAQPVYAAAERFVDHALRRDGSLFTPSRAIWTLENLRDLRKRFVEAPDLTKATFAVKFENQLAGAPADTIQLAAELIYTHFLIAANIGGAAKRRLITRVLSWLPAPLTIPDDLNTALDHGIADTGVAFKTYRPHQLWLLVEFAVRWKELPGGERERLLTDPWAFKAFLETVPLTSAYQQFNALLHLVHPATFESIVSREHKELIAAAFPQGNGAGEDVDRRLYAVREALTQQRGEPIHFYRPGTYELWHGGKETPHPAEGGGEYLADNPIRSLLSRFLEGWVDSTSQPLKDHPIKATLTELRDALATEVGVDREVFRVDLSVGAGNWAQVPWIAFLHRAETDSTQQGIYPVYLFRADGTGVYLTLAQGVTKSIQELGRVKAREEMATRSRRVRDLLEGELPSFTFDSPAELRGSTALANSYEASIIAQRFYAADELPDDEELTADLSELIQAYTAFIEGRVRQRRSWVFQANPEQYRLTDAVSALSELTWNIQQHRTEIARGDEVFLWEAGPNAGIVAVARVEEAPAERLPLPEEAPFIVEPRGAALQCVLRIEAAIPHDRVLRSELLTATPGLRILQMAQGTNFAVEPSDAAELYERVAARLPLLVGADQDAEGSLVRYRDRVSQQGRAAMWWSFPLSAEMEAQLQRHPFIYIYQGLPTQALVVRYRIRDWQTQPGLSGLACPWPEYAAAELRGRTSAGSARSEVFKTWFLVDRVERLEPSIELTDLRRADGQSMNPSGLVGGFQQWRRRVAVEAPTLDEVARRTYLQPAQLQDLVSLIREHRQRQIVFEGPPGSGKTFVADMFARYLTGNPLEGPTDERMVTVQFHQSYGYEDFVQGIRPETDPETGQLRYEVRDGVFKALCDRAAADPDRTYVVLIDEINRGNISRILGELLLVLEYREKQVRLAYSPPDATPFSVPENVVVLGTMNTTDRSLTQIDYALRRRFYFYRLMPIEGNDAPVLRGWLNDHGVSPADRDAVLRLFRALNARVSDELDEHFQVGHSYFMRPGIERPEVQEQIWRHAILPLLEEYFYNRPNLRELLAEFSRATLLADAAG